MRLTASICLAVLAFATLTNWSHVQAQICPDRLDVIFVLDGSQSVGFQNWEKVKTIVQDFITQTSATASEARFGVIVYSTSVAPDGKIELATGTAILNRVKFLRYPAQGTYTHLGIDEARKMFSRTKINGIPQLMVVITDGLSFDQTKTASAADTARRAGIEIYAVGIVTAGSPLSKRRFTRELLAIGLTKNNTVELVDFNSLTTSLLTQLTPVCVGGAVNGQWSAWIRSNVGFCQSNCQRSVSLTRTCTNPAPSGGGQQCSGVTSDTITESCSGGNCRIVNGQWSAWTRTTVGFCESACKRTVTVTRSCTNPAPSGGGQQCSGASTDTIREDCTGGSCRTVNGQWSAWFRQRVDFCQSNCKRTVSLTRTCTNPAPSGGGLQCSGASSDTISEDCTGGNCFRVNGQWSAWFRQRVDFCQSNCKRTVSLTRSCTNPAPSGGGLQCSGPSSDTISEDCTGGNCRGVNGQWSAWFRQRVDFCQSNCKRTVSLTRTCTNPAPSGGGLQCSGASSDTISEDCTGGNCQRVNGQWSAWFRQRVDFCQSNCKRTVSLTRSCTNPAPSGGGLQCSGASSDTISEDCTGGNCRGVNGQWSAWFRQRVDFCQSNCKRTVSLTRTCTNPAPSGGGLQCSGASSNTISEDCTGGNCRGVNGQWSAWFRQRVDFCQSNCKRTVSLTRTCTNPAPSGGGLQCSGASSDTISEDCTGGNCQRVNGQWSAWFRQRVDFCQSNCKRTVSLTRSCTNPAPSGGGLQCSGASSDTISEDCTGGNCRGVNGQWSAWFRQRVDFCQSNCKRTVSLTRTCTNPAPSGGGLQCSGASSNTISEDCTGGNCRGVNGQWSAWFRQRVDFCQSNCKRTVSLTRTCTNPAPSGGGLQCSGASSDTISEDCTGGNCLTVNGQWSAWFRQRVDFCQSDCKRTVSLTRTCTNPAPSGGGLQCSGPTSNTIREVCTGGNCRTVNGQWSAWFRQRVDFCQSDCKRTVSLTRTCTNPAPSGGGLQCSGPTSNTIREVCTGDNCRTVNGQWSAWNRQTVGFCQSTCKRTVSLTRSCTNPAPSGGGQQCMGSTSNTITEDCTGGNCNGANVNGQWSSWIRQVGPCQSNCKRTVSLTRTCTNPAPSGSGQQCSGSNSNSITEDCTGGSCRIVDGQWAAWSRIRVGSCGSNCRRSVDLTRTCTNPAPSGGGKECSGLSTSTINEVCTGGACVAEIGLWSQWASGAAGRCSATCSRSVSRTRTCTPSAGGVQGCKGSNSDTIFEACTGDDCPTIGCPFDVLFVVDESELMRDSRYTDSNGNIGFKRVNNQIVSYLEAMARNNPSSVAKAGYITIGMNQGSRRAARQIVALNADMNAVTTAINGVIHQDIALIWSQIIASLPNLIPKGSKVIIITATEVSASERASTAVAFSSVDADFFAIGLPFKKTLTTDGLAPLATKTENIRVLSTFTDTSILSTLQSFLPSECPKAVTGVCGNVMDVVVVVDGSFSITPGVFNGVLKTTLIGLTDNLFGMGRDMKIGLVLYSGQVDDTIPLTNSIATVKQSITASPIQTVQLGHIWESRPLGRCLHNLAEQMLPSL
ncbi:SCO-spondin-like isoform X3 [Gigantopelta aegis]|uniref:SCO-spondin-like isoform X3 n=1 Tax=Gigantopelta aegis TaxID=1735272 RepID=UPI001B88A208|nr:SCO-spondin-like isoform X3 [Gigantopelta aegis]